MEQGQLAQQPPGARRAPPRQQLAQELLAKLSDATAKRATNRFLPQKHCGEAPAGASDLQDEPLPPPPPPIMESPIPHTKHSKAGEARPHAATQGRQAAHDAPGSSGGAHATPRRGERKSVRGRGSPSRRRPAVEHVDLLYPIMEEEPKPSLSENLEAYRRLRLHAEMSRGDGVVEPLRVLSYRIDLFPDASVVSDETDFHGACAAAGRCRVAISYSVHSYIHAGKKGGNRRLVRTSQTEIEALGVFREECSIALTPLGVSQRDLEDAEPDFTDLRLECAEPPAQPPPTTTSPKPCLTPGSMSSLSSLASPRDSDISSEGPVLRTASCSLDSEECSSSDEDFPDSTDNSHGLGVMSRVAVDLDVLSSRTEVRQAARNGGDPDIHVEERDWQWASGGFVLVVEPSQKGFGLGSELFWGGEFGFIQDFRKATKMRPGRFSVQPISLDELLFQRKQKEDQRTMQRRRLLSQPAFARFRRLKSKIEALRKQAAGDANQSDRPSDE